MRFIYSFLFLIILLSNDLIASDPIIAEPNADGSKRRAVSLTTPELASTPSEHNSKWEMTQLPTLHRLAKDIIVDYLLSPNSKLSITERYELISSAHNLFLTCKHWAEYTIDRPSYVGAKKPVVPRWTPMWKPLTLFNEDQKRVELIRTAMYHLLAEITGFDQATAKDKTARSTQLSDLYAFYSDVQIGRMLELYYDQYSGRSVASFFVKDYHNSNRTIGQRYWPQVRIIQKRITHASQLTTLNELKIEANLKLIPYNLTSLGTTLLTLDLSNNLLVELPKSIANLQALTSLILKKNNILSHLPSSLKRMTSLRHLDLSETGQPTRTKQWQHLELPISLQSLVMSDVDFSNLETISAPGLTFFDARQNYYPVASTNIPRLLSKLPSLIKLQRLVLGSHTIPTLTDDLARCTTLQSLDLGIGPVNCRHTSKAPKASVLPTSLVNLDLTGNLASDHVRSLRALTNLKILNLFETTPGVIPLNPDITTFLNLSVLAISSPIFAPALFESCTNLEFLSFEGEAIKMAQQGLEGFPLFFQHYTEFCSTYRTFNNLYAAVVSRRPYPWIDHSSRTLLEQMDLTPLLQNTRAQVKGRSGGVWDTVYTNKGTITKDLLINFGSALRPAAFCQINSARQP